MSTTQSNKAENIRNEFQKLFEQSPEEQVEHRAQMLSYIFLSEAQKAMDRKEWTRKRLAKEIGTSASYLTQLFRGDRLLNLKTIAKIEAALEINFGVSASQDTVTYQSREELNLDPSQVNEP
ncbi:MAG: helix-turn-helix transcriptional regulator [Balneolaceae bacterium]|nr:helix-turn-helix transcriptional regulator [Balneolaceae bacterium]